MAKAAAKHYFAALSAGTLQLLLTWADGPGYVRLKARVVGEVKVLFR